MPKKEPKKIDYLSKNQMLRSIARHHPDSKFFHYRVNVTQHHHKTNEEIGADSTSWVPEMADLRRYPNTPEKREFLQADDFLNDKGQDLQVEIVHTIEVNSGQYRSIIGGWLDMFVSPVRSEVIVINPPGNSETNKRHLWNVLGFNPPTGMLRIVETNE